MRLQKIRIRNFRSIRDLEMDLEPTTVLVGPNNAGKTAVLEALRIALSRRWGQQGTGFTEYDFRREVESADPKKSDPIVITAVFGEDQEDEWPESVADILFDVTNLDPETGLRSVILEVSFQFADLKDDFEVKTHFLDPKGSAKTGTAGRSVNFQSFFKVIRVFSLAALRDVITEFRPKSRFWGSLIRNTEIPEGKWQDIGESLKGINAEILDSAELLGKVRDKIQSINEIVTAGAASDVDLRAVPMNEWDLLSRAEVVIKGDKSDPWLPLSLHGQGVQSLSVIYLFQAYVEDVLKKEGVEPFPILLLEEPESHLHPQAARSLGASIGQLSGTKIVTTHSPYFAQNMGVESLRVLRKTKSGTKVCYLKFEVSRSVEPMPNLPLVVGANEQLLEYDATSKVLKAKAPISATKYAALKGAVRGNVGNERQVDDLWKASQLTFTPDELANLNTWARRIRGEIFFSPIWLLVEGQTEHVLINGIMQLCDFPLDVQGISVVDYQNNGNPAIFARLGSALGVDWLLACDGDQGGDDHAKQVAQAFPLTKVANRILQLPEPDNEHYLVRAGWEPHVRNALAKIGVSTAEMTTTDDLVKAAQRPNNKVRLAYHLCDMMENGTITKEEVPPFYNRLKRKLMALKVLRERI